MLVSDILSPALCLKNGNARNWMTFNQITLNIVLKLVSLKLLIVCKIMSLQAMSIRSWTCTNWEWNNLGGFDCLIKFLSYFEYCTVISRQNHWNLLNDSHRGCFQLVNLIPEDETNINLAECIHIWLLELINILFLDPKSDWTETNRWTTTWWSTHVCRAVAGD